ncbi:DUF4385 family protein, partial [Enterobacter cloacae complex sp. 2DZ2F20B]|uniref:DUF4385 family protein n=1 Tax=Enterobacter cloacae complex sp. 2DZ2F20B TaxID=2511993 RepID=UPI0010104821
MTRPFDYQQHCANINSREHPEGYQLCPGEQGEFKVAPHKRRVVPHCRCKDA